MLSDDSHVAPILDIAALSKRMKAGDDVAYRMFYEAYFNRLCRYLLVVAHGDDQLMRDAVQETLRRVARHIRTFETETVFWS